MLCKSADLILKFIQKNAFSFYGKFSHHYETYSSLTVLTVAFYCWTRKTSTKKLYLQFIFGELKSFRDTIILFCDISLSISVHFVDNPLDCYRRISWWGGRGKGCSWYY